MTVNIAPAVPGSNGSQGLVWRHLYLLEVGQVDRQAVLDVGRSRKHGVASALDGELAIEEFGNEERCGDVEGGLGLGTASWLCFGLLVRPVCGFLLGVGWASYLACDIGQNDAEKFALRRGGSLLCLFLFVGTLILINLTVLAHGLLALELVM